MCTPPRLVTIGHPEWATPETGTPIGSTLAGPTATARPGIPATARLDGQACLHLPDVVGAPQVRGRVKLLQGHRLPEQPALHEPCTRHRSASSLTITCAAPVDHLAPGGVLAMWSSNGFPSWAVQQREGRPAADRRPPGQARGRPTGELRRDRRRRDDHGRHPTARPVGQLVSALGLPARPALDQHDREVRQLLAFTAVHD